MAGTDKPSAKETAIGALTKSLTTVNAAATTLEDEAFANSEDLTLALAKSTLASARNVLAHTLTELGV